MHIPQGNSLAPSLYCYVAHDHEPYRKGGKNNAMYHEQQ